jgi:hypothetical protein
MREGHAAETPPNDLPELSGAADDIDLRTVSPDLSLPFRCPGQAEQDDSLREIDVSEYPVKRPPALGRTPYLDLPLQNARTQRSAGYVFSDFLVPPSAVRIKLFGSFGVFP